MTTELNAYYRELERRLGCPKAKREEFIEETRRHITHYIEDHPHAEFPDVVRFAGEPEELAQTYNELLGPEVTERFRRGRRIRRVVSLGVLMLALVAAVIYSVYLWERQQDVDITEEKTIVVYKTEEGENP